MGIAEEGELHRRRAQGEDAEAMAGGVAGEIDQEVDAIGADAAVQGLIIEASGLDPLRGGLAGPGRIAIVHRTGVIHRHLKLIAIEALQQRQHEQVDRMLAVEISRHQPEPQGPVGVAAVGEVLGGGAAGLDRGAEVAVPLGHLLGAELIDIEGGHGDAGGQAGGGVAECGVMGLHRSQVGAGIAAAAGQGIEQKGHLGVGRIELQNLLADRFGFAELVHLPVKAGEGLEGGDVLRGQLAGPLEHGERLLPVVVLVDPLGQQAQEGGVGGGGGAAEGQLGGSAVADAHQGEAQLQHRAMALGLLLHQGGQGLHRPLGIAGIQAPEPEPVARLALDRLKSFGPGQGRIGQERIRQGPICQGASRWVGAAIAEAGQVEPAEPIVGAVGEPSLQILDPGLGGGGMGLEQQLV